MKMFKRSLVASSIVASLCITSTAYADDIEVKISNSLLDTYTDKYEEADLVVMKLSDIRLSAMAYWAQNQSYPTVINDLVADSFYFGTFTTTFGSVINGANNVDSYALTIDLPSPELASYVASSVNGTYTGNTVRLEFGLPMSAIARDVSLSRFDDPANPDLNRMETNIDMNNNSIDNVGTLTASSAVISGDLIVNAGSNSFEMTSSGLTYNGSTVVTEDNIATFTDTSDLVSKTEDAIMNGAYTITGTGSSLNLKNSRLNYYNGSEHVGFIGTVGGERGIAIGRDNQPLLLVGDGANLSGLIYKPTNSSSRISLEAGWFGVTNKLFMERNASFYSKGGQTWIGSDDGFYAEEEGASLSTNIAASEGGEVNLIVGKNTDTPDYALIARNDIDGNAYTSLMYNSFDRLSTNLSGVNVIGGITVQSPGGDYFNLSESEFSYKGNEVLTASNFMTYAASASDAVSKTQDGTLRGLYTIDGLEDDGITANGAALILTNNANLNLQSGSKIIGQDIYLHASRFNKSFVTNGGFYSESHLEFGKAYIYGSEVVNIGLKKDTNQDATPTLNLYGKDVVAIRGNGTRSKSTALEANFVDGKASVELMYDGKRQLKTTQNGLSLQSSLIASYDSNGDSIADTEYLNLSEASFTYNGAEIITEDNIATYTGGVTDAVSKSQDGVLRGLYTIDGLESDGVTNSDSGILLINNSFLQFGGGSNTFRLSPHLDGFKARTQSHDFIVINQGDFVYNARRDGSVVFNSYSFNGGVREGNGKVFVDNEGLELLSDDPRFYAGLRAFRGNLTLRASQNVHLGFQDGGNVGVLGHGLDGSNDFLRASKNAGAAQVSLLYANSDRLTTTSSGVAVTGNIISKKDNGDGTFTDVLNLSDRVFTYNGADVITEANINTYTGGVTDAVSKSQDGLLRGLYTIDGLEDDGVTSSGAGLNFVNGAFITGDIKVVDGVNSYFVLNKSGQTKDGAGLRYEAIGPNTDVRFSGKSETGTAELILDGYARLRSVGGGDVFIGVADERIESFGGASGKVFVGAKDNITLAVGNSTGLNPAIILEGKNDTNNNAYVSLKYNSLTRLNTNVEGVEIHGDITAKYDSDADGVGDTEYVSIEGSLANNTLSIVGYSDSFEALTYNAVNKVWATNAELSASDISTSTLSAQFITADDITVNTRLTVDGVDVGQWIKDCEAGISSGCSL